MTQDRSENNKRIAKNTFALYCRTAIVMLVSLFVVRVLLRTLGEEDYGIYNLVAGVVVLFTFLSASMTQAIQRFVTYELGRGDKQSVRKVFSMSIVTQLLIIVVLIMFCEVIGIWFINTKLEIDPNRLKAANWAFHFSVLTFCIHLLRIPYESSVIAYEKMSFFAYASIIDSVIKLSIVYLLTISPTDKLVFYSFLLTLESLLMFFVYQIFCRRKFDTCSFILVWDKVLFVRIITFSGWSICGSATNIATQKGLEFLLNIFVGVVANAAMGIANQVSSAVNSFVTGFQTSFRPQIVKAYAQGDNQYLTSLITKTSKYSFILIFIPSFFIIVNAPLILKIWLVDFPEYTVAFCRLILVCCVIDGVTGPYNCAIMATEKIRSYQIAISISFTLDLVVSYFLWKVSISPNYILWSRILTRGVINMFIGLYYLNQQQGFDIRVYIRSVLFPILRYLILILPLVFLAIYYCQDWSLFWVSGLYCVTIGIIAAYYGLLNSDERRYLITVIKNRLYAARQV